ncbi:MAG: ParA family protein [Bryobacterales bacterium]|nr:ParA family protein [Bryobacterales bacterium]
MARPALGRLIAFGNQKGGVGKTTTTINVAAALARKGRSVCLVDVDNNRGLTRTFSVPEEAFRSTFDIFTGEAEASECIIKAEFQTLLNGTEAVVHLPERFAIIPASRSLESLDQVIAQRPSIRPEKNFARALADLRSSFDYVFVDTAPNLTTPTVIAYNTVPWFILTARPGKTAMDSLSDAVQDLLQVKQFGAEGRLLGVVLTEVDVRTRLSKDIVQFVDEEFRATLENKKTVKLGFQNHISKTIAIEEAPYAAQTIFDYRANSRACAEYEALAEEIETRLKNFESLFGMTRGQADEQKRAANE